MQLQFISIIVAAFCLGEVICRSFTKEEGPYNVIISNTTKCFADQTWFQTNTTAYTRKRKSLLRGTISTKREVKNVKFRIQINYIDDAAGKVKLFEIKNQNCHNTIIQLVRTAVGLPFNMKNCSMKPMYHEFDNLNIDAIFHTIVKSAFYGSGQVRWEMAMPSTMLICLDINVQIVRAT